MPTVDSILGSIRRGMDMLREYDRAAEVQRIHVTPFATRTIEDWTDVRSPGRAARRRAKHRQRIRVAYGVPCIMRVGPVIMVHPDKWSAIVDQAGPLKADPTLPGASSLYGIPVTFHDQP